jgi:glycosyltransferase involved in cell wall biosynthesis
LQAEFSDVWSMVAPLGYRSDPWPFYAAADVVAIPSLSEGSPLVLFEAMAAGRPIVASEVGGIPEVIADRQSGILVPAADTQRLAAALAQVLGDAELARGLGDNAARAAREFAPDRYGARLRDVYQRVLSAA